MCLRSLKVIGCISQISSCPSHFPNQSNFGYCGSSPDISAGRGSIVGSNDWRQLIQFPFLFCPSLTAALQKPWIISPPLTLNLKRAKWQIETEDISVSGLDCDRWQKALPRLVSICHFAPALLFSGSEWDPLRWVLLQIRWLPRFYTSARPPPLRDPPGALALPLNSLWKAVSWNTTGLRISYVRHARGKCERRREAFQHHRYWAWLWESCPCFIRAQSSEETITRYHWYVDEHTINQENWRGRFFFFVATGTIQSS